MTDGIDDDVQGLLSSDPHHSIVQVILGHPEHLASEDEISLIVEEDITSAVADLVDADILSEYHQPSNAENGLPTTFYGLSEYGIDVLENYNYLQGVPMARAVHQKTQKPERIKRHEDAPRPSLPDTVRRALTAEDNRQSRYKLDVTYNSARGTVCLHVHDFAVDADDAQGPVETCEVGEDLDDQEMRRAWDEFHGIDDAIERWRGAAGDESMRERMGRLRDERDDAGGDRIDSE